MLDHLISKSTYYMVGIGAFILNNLNEIAIIVGIVCTIASTVINWYFKCREAKHRDRSK